MKVKIKDIARVLNGSTPSTKCPKYYDGDILWITPKDLSDQKGKYIYAGERTITQEGYDSCSTEMIPKDNILMSSRAPIGLLAINKVDCCTNQGFKSLVVDKTKCSEEYLYYYLKYHIKEIEALGSGTTFKEVSKDSMEKYEIELPELSKQEKIVNILADLDEKIINNNAINAELESMAKTIYDYWFLQFEFPNEDGKPYKSSGGKMVWNEELKREIPEGWEVSDLSKLCDFNNGINYDKEELGDKDYKIVNVRNISSTTLLLDKSDLDTICLKSNQADKYLVEDDDILIARSGTPGAVRLLESDVNDIIYCGFIIRCKPKNKEQRYYLTYSLKLLEGSNATKTGGSILQNVSQETLKQISVCIPPNEIVKKYNESINDILRKMQNVIEENRELTSLRDFLIPMLMNGQIGFKDGE